MTLPLNRRDFLSTSAGLALAASAPAIAGEPAGDPDRLETKIQANSKIQQAREVALDILKPTEQDLQHGLELHRNSLVFESYGFAPRAAPDGDAVRAALESGASEVELGDLYEEMRMTRCATNEAEQEEFKMAWKASGVTCIFQNAGEEGQDPLRLIKRLARFTYVTDTLREFVTRAVTSEDVVAAKQQNRHAMCFSGNGVPLTQDWISTHDELRYVRIFYQLGIRMMHLTYNRRNMLGDGCAEPANAGISAFGHDAIAEMNRVGVLIDVAHCGWRTSQETAEASEKPVVASHTTCTALHNHIRSKPDEVIRTICDTGGYIGICCIPAFLGSNGDIAAMMDHLDYAIRRFGADHVAIGTDIAYLSRNNSIENKKIPRRRGLRKRWAYFWPDGALDAPRASRESMAWTNWPLFTVGLVQRGHSDEAIRKVLGGNVLRVLEAVRNETGF